MYLTARRMALLVRTCIVAGIVSACGGGSGSPLGNNSAPVISSVALINATEGQLYQYAVAVSDVDSDALTFVLSVAPSGMTIVPNGVGAGVISWTPTNTQVGGPHSVMVVVSDGQASDSQSWSVTVTAAGGGANDPPVITSAAATTATVGAAYGYQVTATDADGDPLAYGLTAFPAGMTISASGLISWTPVAGQVGANNVTISVSDGTAAAVQSWQVTVVASIGGNNNAPVITSTAVITATQGVVYSYRVVATGTPTPSISAFGDMSGWLTFDGTDTISGTPGLSDTGKLHNVTVIASNGTLPNASQRFVVSVSPDNAGWEISTVDIGGTGRVEGSSVAMDGNNKAHMAYTCFTIERSALNYATNLHGVWSSQTIEGEKVYPATPSIVLDATGYAHVSYAVSVDLLTSNLKYATNASGSWVTQTVDSTGSAGSDASLALDSSGKVHISYYDSTNDDLKYATNASGTWIAQTIDSTGNVGMTTSIKLDAGGKAHIGYYDVTNGDLKYMTNVTGSWVTQIVDSVGNVGWYASLALDAGGRAHICYRDGTNVALKYAIKTPTTWNTQTVSAADNVSFTSLTLDANGKAHIGYCDVDSGRVKYLTNSSGTWAMQIIDSTELDISTGSPATYSSFVSLALDGSGMAHACYDLKTTATGDMWLKYATNGSGSWGSEVVDSSVGFGWQASPMKLDASGKAHVCYRDTHRETLRYATNVSGNWVTQNIRTRGGAQPMLLGDASLAMDANGKAHISYDDYANFDMDYITNVSGNWSTQNIAIDGLGLKTCPIALDASGRAHVAANAFGILSYASNQSGLWSVDYSVGTDCAYQSIVLDVNGKAHISYYNPIIGPGPDKRDLVYTTNASGSWVTQTVDSVDDVGQYSSIALDANGKAHISYRYKISDFAGHLRYATNASGAWTIQTVDSVGNVGYYSSIALDLNGNVHISHHDGNANVPKYSTNVAGSWNSEVVDSSKVCGSFSSMALDASGKPHMSYYDANNRILKYAKQK